MCRNLRQSIFLKVIGCQGLIINDGEGYFCGVELFIKKFVSVWLLLRFHILSKNYYPYII